MKLIIENIDETEVVIEEAQGKKSLYITGPFLQADVGNLNKRIYPSNILDPEVENYIEKYVKEGRAWGELNHPNTPTINLERVSHRIVSLIKEKSTWYGKAKLSPTPLGQIATQLIEDGGKLGVSSRSLGNLSKRDDGLDEVSSLRIMTAADIVSDPSGPGCFVNGIMENVEFWFDEERGDYIQEYTEKTKNKLKKFTTKQIEEAKLYIFEEYLNQVVKNIKN